MLGYGPHLQRITDVQPKPGTGRHINAGIGSTLGLQYRHHGALGDPIAHLMGQTFQQTGSAGMNGQFIQPIAGQRQFGPNGIPGCIGGIDILDPVARYLPGQPLAGAVYSRLQLMMIGPHPVQLDQTRQLAGGKGTNAFLNLVYHAQLSI